MISNPFKAVGMLCMLIAFSTHCSEIYQQQLLRLDSMPTHGGFTETLRQFSGKPMVLSFFMPNCKWCQRQHQSLKQLKSSCPNVQSIMLGVQGSKNSLKQELRKKRNQFPAYMANSTIIKAVGTKTPVPFMLVFNSSGALILKTMGYTPKEKLVTMLEKQDENMCQS